MEIPSSLSQADIHLTPPIPSREASVSPPSPTGGGSCSLSPPSLDRHLSNSACSSRALPPPGSGGVASCTLNQPCVGSFPSFASSLGLSPKDRLAIRTIEAHQA